MRAVITLLLCTATMWSCTKNERPDNEARLSSVKAMQGDQLKFNMQGASLHDYNEITDYAIAISADTNADTSIKGQVILSVVARCLGDEIEKKTLDPTDDDVSQLLKKYEQQQYFIYQPRMSNFQKLIYQAKKGNYVYICKRLSSEWYFFPGIVVVAGSLTFGAWKSRRRLRRVTAKLFK